MKMVKSLEESSLLITGVSEATKNEANEGKGGFLSMLLGTLGNLLKGKGVKRSKIPIQGVMRTDEKQLEQDRIFNVASSFR